ncbi:MULTISPECIES: DUF952 domain-containing protein [Nocardioides]|uniref:DUF952 domain-containing protein n=1 Tax=Nocardioides vastitatis TaxID=2568655 RepID=A0ABW0ZE31_9ACTN|nr:DUF952 domain-containing protein [Nocardioides sp.]THJ03814.1 DUF952 domain-containing protein [Nocardioides sp.]
MVTIFHIAFARDWAAAQEAGAYVMSTRGRTLAEEGFIHCSRGDQWPAVRAAFYGDVDPASDPLLLLHIDTTRLDVPVVEEPPEPGSTEAFPHIYGPLPLDAVVRAVPLDAAAAAPAVRSESFSRLFFREVAFNVAMVLVVIALGTAGIALGALVEERIGPGIGGIVGVLVGVASAVRLYRNRHPGRPSAA